MNQEVTTSPLYTSTEYPKSNMLIAAKYSSTLLENKILALSLFDLKNKLDVDPEESLSTTFTAKEVRLLTGRKGGSVHAQLNKVAQQMLHRSIGFNDEENERFYYANILRDVTYEDGNITIQYNPIVRAYLEKKQNFTILDVSIMMGFSSIYSFRLYELLKSKAEMNDNTLSSFRVEFSIAELKLNLGMIDAEAKEVKQVLIGNANPDYEKAVSVAKEQKFESWGSFKRRVIDVAIKEINQKTDLLVLCVPLASGRGGKIHSLEFLVDQQPVEAPVIPLDEIRKKERLAMEKKYAARETMFISSVKQCMLETLDTNILKKLAVAADYDVELFLKAYTLSKKTKQELVNLGGFLLDTILELQKEKEIIDVDILSETEVTSSTKE